MIRQISKSVVPLFIFGQSFSILDKDKIYEIQIRRDNP
jgi:hypothetical protein